MTATIERAGTVLDGCPVCLGDLAADGTCPDVWCPGPAREPEPDGAALAAQLAEETALAEAGQVPEPDPEGDPLALFAGVPAVLPDQERPMIPLDLGDIPLIVPRADVTLGFGSGSIGKGRMTWSLIAAVTQRGGDAIVILPEDKQDEQMAARAAASGAAGDGVPGRVWNMTRLPGSAQRFKLSAAERYTGHIGHLRGFIEQLQREGRDPRLVVIDPISSVVGWGSMLQVAGARRLIEPLQDLADSTGVAVWCIGHCTAAGKLAGSEGLRDALRLIYRITPDSLNTAHRVVTVEKANNLPPGVDGLRFTVTEDAGGRVRVEWLSAETLEAQRGAWRERLDSQQPAGKPSVLDAIGAGCKPGHAAARFGTPSMCGDCKARRLLTQPAGRVQAPPPRRPAPPPAGRTSGLYAATYAVTGPGGQAPGSLGPHYGLGAAQDACQQSRQAGGQPLTWAEYKPGQWLATTRRGTATVAFAVVKAPERI